MAALALLVGAASAEERVVDFLRDVKPILAERCFRCHSSLEQESNLRLDSVPAILKGGDGGAVVVAGKVDESRLIAAVERRGELKMPPEGEALSAAQIATLKAWIAAGAITPAAEAKVDHWSFQKPGRPAVPVVRDAAWSGNPIDAFIAAKHEERGLKPVGLAPPNLLLRRVYFDLIGLPPTPEELNQGSSYEEVVDKLLASPAYGERWGRHWMDVWRYSDWDGYKQEIRESQPHIWRWRDWIVESLNADKPYDRMVQEMLAGDELAPSDPETLRATGYLVRSWYKFNRNKWLDDAIEHTGKAFLGLTFNCCRCHDHMYDPLSQKDYYALRAFFEPYDVRTDRLPGEADTAKAGLVRVFDAKSDAPTFLFMRGNEKDPVKDEALAPQMSSLFGEISCRAESIALPKEVAYPGLSDFVRREAIVNAKEELEKARAALAKAEKKLAEAFVVPPVQAAGAEPRPPSPPVELFDADAAFALARANVAAAEARLAFNEVRVLADDASFADPPAASAKALATAANIAEREFKLRQAEKGLIQAEIAATLAERAKKPGDAKTTKAVTDTQTALIAARKARADAVLAPSEPKPEYTRFTPAYPATSTGRRLALARWITSKENPLAARVAVNHIWLRHFGSPLVSSVFDFGLKGKEPTNQALLDWLAIELMENGWRMKHVHRLIVTSRTYRLASSGALNSATLDPENVYNWRANVRRLEAEAVRDGVLQAAGSLDVSRGGPDLDPNLGLTSGRRSLYFRSAKEKKVELLSLFDSPNPVECYRRSESIAPQQALALANSTLTLAQSRILAKKIGDSLAGQNGDVAQKFVQSAFVRILCRQPTEEELRSCGEFLAEQAIVLADQTKLAAFSTGPAAIVPPANDPHQRARENLVHVLFNHNDFVTVR